MDASEKFWIGSEDCWTQGDKVVNHMRTTDGQDYFECTDGLRLDCDYSDFSVRIYHQSDRTLSFVLKTIAILPKSTLRSIHKMIGDYLEKY